MEVIHRMDPDHVELGNTGGRIYYFIYGTEINFVVWKINHTFVLSL